MVATIENRMGPIMPPRARYFNNRRPFSLIAWMFVSYAGYCTSLLLSVFCCCSKKALTLMQSTLFTPTKTIPPIIPIAISARAISFVIQLTKKVKKFGTISAK